jgi:GNAT superfamily N-acetyltransferase
MALRFRKAVPEDAAPCIVLRGKTRENAFSAEQLAAIGITLDSWRNGIEDGSSPGFVCQDGDDLVGMCFCEKDSGEILVAAVLPEFETHGIGKRLLNLTLEELRKAGHTKSFLGCTINPSARSHGFYRHLGWTSTGTKDALGDEVLELPL